MSTEDDPLLPEDTAQEPPADADAPVETDASGEDDAQDAASFRPLDAAAIAAVINASMTKETFGPPGPFDATGASARRAREKTPPVEACLEELAEDMLDLLERVRGIEGSLAELHARLGQLDKQVRDGMFLQARELDSLRTELVGEHKVLLGLGSLHAVAPALDRFRLIRAAVDSAVEPAAAAQFDAAIDMLGQVLRSLGFEPFEPEQGEPFDPARMQCVARRPGPAAGTVLAVDRPGYRTHRGVARPAAVVLATPDDPEPNPEPDPRTDADSGPADL